MEIYQAIKHQRKEHKDRTHDNKKDPHQFPDIRSVHFLEVDNKGVFCCGHFQYDYTVEGKGGRVRKNRLKVLLYYQGFHLFAFESYVF